MSNGVYYRGEAVNYGPTACSPSLMRQPWFSLTQENNYYQHIILQFADTALFKSIKEDAESREFNFFKMLGLLQHYGFETRLLDLTRNKNVATYFASCDHFGEAGAIYVFEDNSIRNVDKRIKGISRKMRCILESLELQHKNIIDALDIKKRALNTIVKDVIVDYEVFYKKTFGSIYDNLRLNRQDGAFILPGISLDDNYCFDNRRFIIKYDAKLDVEREMKIGNLIDLLLLDEPIT